MTIQRVSAARARPARVNSTHVQPPDGINVADNAAALGPTDAMLMDNLLRAEYGLVPRHGWREIAIAIGGGAEIRTVLPYSGSKTDGTKSKLFIATQNGIYEIVPSTGVSTLVYTFVAHTSDSGYGTFTMTTTVADKFLVYADEENGYILYTESTDTWAPVIQGTSAGQLKGVDPKLLCHVVSWKNRLWFTEKNSMRAWYLPIGLPVDNTTGATVFDFGAKLRYGGYLVGLWDWTVSAGAGPDSTLVGISSAGDVIVYHGTDPSSLSTFGIVGVWYVGQVPFGRRIATDIGGDLLILSTLGLLPLSSLVHGGEKLDPNLYASRKIAPLLSTVIRTNASSRGWDLRVNPTDAALMVLLPSAVGYNFAMSMCSKGWSRILGIPMVCGDTWNGQFYFGTSDGRVGVIDGYVDGMHRDGTGATSIPWKFIGAFSSFESSNRKIVRVVSPDFMTQDMPPSYAASVKYDFDISDETVSEFASPSSSALWDTAVWDSSAWSSGVGTAGANVGAPGGVGTHVAVMLSGHSSTRVVLMGAQVIWESGGML